MDLLDILARFLGVFYAIGGAFTLRAVAGDAVLDKALSALSHTPTAREDITRRWFMTAAAALTGLSGIALLMLSGWALPLFLANLALQAGWLTHTARRDAADSEEALGRRRRINAALLWTAATALVTWLNWHHRLTTLLEPWTPALMGMAVVAGLAWVLPHLTWQPASPPLPEPAWDGSAFIPPPERVRLAMRYGCMPLYDADTGFAVNAADYIPVALFERLCAWEAAYCDTVDPQHPDEPAPFTREQAIAHREEGLAIAAALEEVFGAGNVEAPLYGEGARPALLPDQDAAPA